MRIALAVLTLWLSLPSLLCEAVCDASIARASVPPCHAQPDPEAPPVPHDRESCAGCEADGERFVTTAEPPSARGSGAATVGLALAVAATAQPVEFALRHRERAPPRAGASPYARNNPPLLI